MDEIYYIVGIDARPWQKTPKIGATIPLALLFGAIVAFRQALNQGGPFPDIKGSCGNILSRRVWNAPDKISKASLARRVYRRMFC